MAPERLNTLIKDAYAPLTSLINVFVTTPYGDARRHVRALAHAGVHRIHLDLVRGALPTAADLDGASSAGIVAGVIDGRNVWKADQGVAAARVQAVRDAVEAAGGDPETVGCGPIGIPPTRAPLSVRRDYPGVRREEVRMRVAELGREAYSRVPYAQRLDAHAESLPLPTLPATTIGSFPQTEEIRTARREFRSALAPDRAGRVGYL